MNASEFGYDISDISREVRSKWGSIIASGCVTLGAGIISSSVGPLTPYGFLA